MMAQAKRSDSVIIFQAPVFMVGGLYMLDVVAEPLPNWE